MSCDVVTYVGTYHLESKDWSWTSMNLKIHEFILNMLGIWHLAFQDPSWFSVFSTAWLHVPLGAPRQYASGSWAIDVTYGLILFHLDVQPKKIRPIKMGFSPRDTISIYDSTGISKKCFSCFFQIQKLHKHVMNCIQTSCSTHTSSSFSMSGGLRRLPGLRPEGLGRDPLGAVLRLAAGAVSPGGGSAGGTRPQGSPEGEGNVERFWKVLMKVTFFLDWLEVGDDLNWVICFSWGFGKTCFFPQNMDDHGGLVISAFKPRVNHLTLQELELSLRAKGLCQLSGFPSDVHHVVMA